MNRPPSFDSLSRRAALMALGSLFASPSLRRGAEAASEPAFASDPFSLGVASGMPRSDSVVLWTRLAPLPHEPNGGMPDVPVVVGWELAENEQFSRGLRTGQVTARTEHAHSIHIEVTGLPEGTPFFYRFTMRGAVSPVGRTRTAPGADADVLRLRVALASCQHYEQGSFVAHRDIAARDLDLVLFVGDYIYESSNPRYRLRAHEGPVPTTLDGYRARHATYKLDPDLRAAHAAHPWLVTWDDHEVENDYAADHSAKGMGEFAFLQRRAAAYKAYFEHMPVSPAMAPAGPAMRIHARHEWGRLAELWTLDNRQYRSLQPCGLESGTGGRIVEACAGLADPAGTVFGREQERWVTQGLATSRRRWKILAQGSQLSPSGIDSPVGRRIHSDGWDGYPMARERLLLAMAGAAGGNVLCLGGDVHRHVAAQLRLRPNDPASPIVASEFVCTSVSSRGLSESLTGLMRSSNPDTVHARSDERGYALLEITHRGATCEFRGTPFPAGAQARLNVQATFAVEHDRAGILTA